VIDLRNLSVNFLRKLECPLLGRTWAALFVWLHMVLEGTQKMPPVYIWALGRKYKCYFTNRYKVLSEHYGISRSLSEH
jgi:hypothetical protein